MGIHVRELCLFLCLYFGFCEGFGLPELEFNPKYFGDTFQEFIEERSDASLIEENELATNVPVTLFIEKALKKNRVRSSTRLPSWVRHNKYMENPAQFQKGVEELEAKNAFNQQSQITVSQMAEDALAKLGVGGAGSGHFQGKGGHEHATSGIRFQEIHAHAVNDATKMAAGAAAAAGATHMGAYQALIHGNQHLPQFDSQAQAQPNPEERPRHSSVASSPFEGGQLPPGVPATMAPPAPQDLLDQAGVGGSPDVPENAQFLMGGKPDAPPSSPFEGLLPPSGAPHYDYSPVQSGDLGSQNPPSPPPPAPAPPRGGNGHVASIGQPLSLQSTSSGVVGVQRAPTHPAVVDPKFLPRTSTGDSAVSARFSEVRGSVGLVHAAGSHRASIVAAANAASKVASDNLMWTRKGVAEKEKLSRALPPDIAPPSVAAAAAPVSKTPWLSVPAGGGQPPSDAEAAPLLADAVAPPPGVAPPKSPLRETSDSSKKLRGGGYEVVSNQPIGGSSDFLSKDEGFGAPPLPTPPPS